MQGPFVRLIDRIRRFGRDTRGSAIVELLLALVLVNLVLTAFFVWWEAYRAEARVERTAYTISDLISRQRGDFLQRPFLDGLERTAEYLLGPDEDAAIRFTQVERFDGVHPNLSGLRINWSYSPCGRIPRAQDDPTFSLAAFPMMAVSASMIMVEVYVPYRPRSSLHRAVGLSDEVFSRTVIAMPRFESRPFTLAASPAGTGTCIG